MGEIQRYEPPAAAARRPDIDHEISAATLDRLERSIPENTKTAYNRQWNNVFIPWCAAAGRTPMPATEHTLAEFVSHLADRDLAPSTIEQAIAAVRVAHRLAGHKGEPDTTEALQVLRTHRRDRADAGKRRREAPPVTIDPLRRMLAVIDPDTLAGLRDRTLLVVGFSAMARRSELAALTIGDLRFDADGVTVTIRRSKTDQAAEGSDVLLLEGVREESDPVRVTRAYLEALAENRVTDGPFLRAVDKWDRPRSHPLSGNAINAIVRRLALAAKLPDAATYTAHGLRAGAPTEAAKAGHPTAFIARHGRWSPTSTQVMKYIRPVDRVRDSPLRNIGL